MIKLSASRRPALALVGVVGALVLGSGAFGQGQTPPPGTPAAEEAAKIRPPVPTVPRNEPSDILGIVFAVLLGAAVVGVNAIPGRRGHQD